MTNLKLSFESDEVRLKVFVASDETKDGIQITTEVIRNGHVLFLNARERLGHIAIEPMNLSGGHEFLVSQIDHFQQFGPFVAIKKIRKMSLESIHSVGYTNEDADKDTPLPLDKDM